MTRCGPTCQAGGGSGRGQVLLQVVDLGLQALLPCRGERLAAERSPGPGHGRGMLSAFARGDHGADRDAHRLGRGQQAGGLVRTALCERGRRQVFQHAAGTPPVTQIVVDLKAVAEQRCSGRVALIGCQQAQLL